MNMLTIKRHKYLPLFLLFLITGIFSCSTTRQIKDPRIAFAQKQFSIAAPLFEEEFAKSTGNPLIRAELAFLAAESYRLSNQTQKAETWYAEAVDAGYDPIAHYHLAQMKKSNMKYEEAILAFEEWAIVEPFNRTKADAEIAAARQAQLWMDARHNVKIENLEQVNTEYADFAPVILENDNIVFSSARPSGKNDQIYGWTGEQFFNLYISQRDFSGNLESPVVFSNVINTNFNEGTVAFNRDFSQIYFTRCGSSGENTDYCNIYTSNIVANGEWSEPVALQLFEDSVNVGHPFLSSDGMRLFFSAKAEGGMGGSDLYLVNRTGDGWSSPISLGAQINTEGDEMFPFLTEDETLYFASDGHPGMGGLDIFRAEKVGNSWRNVRNLQHPINSGADDFGIIFDKTRPANENDPVFASGYFTSTRTGGKGNDDIYSFVMENINLYEVRGIVKYPVYEVADDPGSKILRNDPLKNAQVELIQEFRNNEKKLNTVTVGEDGRFQFDLDRETDYRLFASRSGYFSRSLNITTRKKRDPNNILVTLEVELVLDPIFEQREIEIPNIYYDYDKATLREESLPVLDQLVKMLRENPTVKVEIGSHTDSRGSHEYNNRLSQARAESVVKYFISKGIDTERLVARGYGKTRLVNHCKEGVECSEEEHQQNRRTTFKVTSAGQSVIESVEPEEITVDPKE